MQEIHLDKTVSGQLSTNTLIELPMCELVCAHWPAGQWGLRQKNATRIHVHTFSPLLLGGSPWTKP